ncbi:pre-mRNA-splicing helicase BRR2 [Plasmodium brasilianum]|uniref:Pre-mRNA-splicing helicase BRR2 n=1 Tax=Plasmodium brasilianum TaxID=5824 RepID=A0ACB9YCW9_PLABR|nr:pre-mRNA-splicing helicase BRR2 [Plasmodium brasilianum]
MAEEYEKFKRFEYRMNSNLVLQREGPVPNHNEPTGESESLVGKLKYKMGDKVEYSKPNDLKNKENYRRANNKRKDEFFEKTSKKLKRESGRNRSNNNNMKERSVLSMNIEDIFLYRPTTKYTEQILSKILSSIRNMIGDNTGDIINSTCNEILYILKDDSLNNEEKKRLVDSSLQVTITDEMFIELNNLSKEIYDFNKKEEIEEMDNEEEGVAVVFEEDDDYFNHKNRRDVNRKNDDNYSDIMDELSDDYLDEDEDEDEEEEDEDEAEDEEDEDEKEEGEDENEYEDDTADEDDSEKTSDSNKISGRDDEKGKEDSNKKEKKLKQKRRKKKKKKKKNEEEDEEEEEKEKQKVREKTTNVKELNHLKRKKKKYENHLSLKNVNKDFKYKNKNTENYDLDTNSIDAHWLQRELNKVFTDPSLCLEKEKEVLNILKIYDIQECENKLVNILKYENFSMAKLLIKNRWKIYYCTLLGQAQTEKEKKYIMENMKKTEEGEEILEDLSNFKNFKKNKQSEFVKTMRKEADNLFNKEKYEHSTNEFLPEQRFIHDDDEMRAKGKDDEDEDENEVDTSVNDGTDISGDSGDGNVSGDSHDEEGEGRSSKGNKKSNSREQTSRRGNAGKVNITLDGNKKKKGEKSSYIIGENFKGKYIDLEKMDLLKKNNDFLNKEVILPSDSKRIEKKEYDEIIIRSMKDRNSSNSSSSISNKKIGNKCNYFTSPDEIRLIPVTELPEWSQEVFSCVNITKLNAIQSKVYDTAFNKYEENMLICAPTGSGKTNIALLCILNVINSNRLTSGNIDKKNFKVIYISPMKALVNEQVQSFNLRLKCMNLKVSELTGDVHLSSKEIDDSQIIVMTPEKLEIISRKWNEKILLQKVKLIIFDEIHLLNEVRGNVLESIITRINRYIDNTLIYDGSTTSTEETARFGKDKISSMVSSDNHVVNKNETIINMNKKKIRLVGLSATLPNYEDVGLFLRADLQKGVFYFDYSFRPVQLEQYYIGIKEKKGIKKYALMNDITYEKVLEEAGKNQILIFVHSRKETYRTAKILIDRFMKSDNLSKFLIDKKISTEILLSEKEAIVNDELKEILPFGFGIHHAGLKRTDRKLVEDLFSDKHLQVLVSTSTLAWGINLPAHTVIIKGTSVYNINIGDFDELSAMDVLQMIGRSGRPQYDKNGKAIIITDHKNLQLYLSLNNEQLFIESTLLNNIVNIINAEIVLKNIQNLKDAINWFNYTYMYIRMMKNPSLYGIQMGENFGDIQEFLSYKENYDLFRQKVNKRIYNIIYSSFLILEKYDLIKYNKKLNTVSSTYMGKISSYYYVDYKSIDMYNKKLNKYTNEIDLLKIFTMSEEFRNIYIREEEKVELSIIMEKLPIPVKESINIPYTKINILLQLYLSNITLSGYIINADLVYIHQNALRIFRSFFEISLRKNSYSLIALTLKFSKMIERRMWSTMTPLRQFGLLSNELIRVVEKKNISFKNYITMNINEYITIFKNKKIAKNIYKLVHHFPKIDLNAYIQPINHKILKVELNITPDFIYNPKYHGYSMLFWVFVFDISNENILHYDLFTLKKNYKTTSIFESEKDEEENKMMKKNKKDVYSSSDTLDDHLLTFFLPINENPYYIVKVISDKWLECECTVNLYLNDLILPSKNFYSTQLLDLQPLPLNSLKYEIAKKFFLSRNIKLFSPIYTQVFSSIYENNGNVIICSSSSKYYLIPAELAIIKIVKCLHDLNSYMRKYIKNEKDLYKIMNDKKLADMIYNNPLELMKVVYIAPLEEIVLKTYKNWIVFKNMFHLNMCILSGDVQVDMKLLQKSNIILSTPNIYDNISKKWRRKKILQNVNLYIFDHMELLDTTNGAIMEVVISRIRYISTQLQLNKSNKKGSRKSVGNSASLLLPILDMNLVPDTDNNNSNNSNTNNSNSNTNNSNTNNSNSNTNNSNTNNSSSKENFITYNINKLQNLQIEHIYESIGLNRILCLSSCSLYNCKDFSEWIGCKKNDYYNFLSSVRNIPIEIYLHAVNIMNKQNRYMSMQRQVYQNIRKLNKKKNVIIFVTEQKLCKTLALDLILSAYNDNTHFYSIFENYVVERGRSSNVGTAVGSNGTYDQESKFVGMRNEFETAHTAFEGNAHKNFKKDGINLTIERLIDSNMVQMGINRKESYMVSGNGGCNASSSGDSSGSSSTRRNGNSRKGRGKARNSEMEDERRDDLPSNEDSIFDYINDKMLVQLMKNGLCYLHSNMTEVERKIVEMLFDKKAIQILIVAYDYIYSLNVYGNTIIILDTIITHFDNKEEDYSIQNVLEMISYAGRQGEDVKSFVYIYTYITKKEYYKNFIYEPLTVESNIEDYLPNFLNNEIVMSTIENYQDAIDWLTWSFFYRRIKKNPNYYGLKGISNEHITDYLSELIENNIEIISFANCINIEEESTNMISLKPCNLGIISSFYNLDYHVVHFFNEYILSLKNLKKNKILEIICLSNVFIDLLKINNYDIYLCLKISKSCNIEVTYEFLKLSLNYEKNLLKNDQEGLNIKNDLNKSGENGKKDQYIINLLNFITVPTYFTAHLKALIILQAHINRYSIPINYIEETKKVLLKIFKLINALVDVISSNNILNFCLFVMEVSQMITQSVTNTNNESSLLQLPHFDSQLIKKANEMEIMDVYDLINADDDKREFLLKHLNEKQKSQIANVCNIFPIIEVQYEIDLNKTYKVNEIATLNLTIERDLTDEDISSFAHSLYLPFEKEEMWWIVIGIKKMNLLLSIKKLSLLKPVNNVKINFELPSKPNTYQVVIYVINDCYVGCDQEYEFRITVEG